MIDHRRFPYHSYPSSWYQVAWSDELVEGETQARRYFDRDLVVYRGESGTAFMFDAHCPHLGAHIGVGGTVVGDEVQCPFHGWRFDAQGVNCLIPYADKPNRSRLIFKWPVVERGGLVLAWYDKYGRPPAWIPEPLPELDAEPERFPAGGRFRHSWPKVRLKPQFIIENLVDAAHQKYVHGAHDVPTIERCEPEGPKFHVNQRVEFGKGKKKTWLTPDGTPVSAVFRTEAWGLGFAVARFELDEAIHVQTVTPIDGEFCESRATVILTQKDVENGRPTEQAERRFRHECKQFENDLPIWENQWFVHPAPFPAGESNRFHAMRRWSTQFYPEAEPGHFGRFRELDDDGGVIETGEAPRGEPTKVGAV
jgi:3-ketosteroid 9alpha-monooxygenase subunit A